MSTSPSTLPPSLMPRSARPTAPASASHGRRRAIACSVDATVARRAASRVAWRRATCARASRHRVKQSAMNRWRFCALRNKLRMVDDVTRHGLAGARILWRRQTLQQRCCVCHALLFVYGLNLCAVHVRPHTLTL